MLFTKQMCVFCSSAMAKRFCDNRSNVTSKLVREFSSENSDNRNKKPTKIVIKAKNDFVTHQLNTSFSAHLKRQQKIRDYVQAEEQKLLKQNLRDSNDWSDENEIDLFQEKRLKNGRRDKSFKKTASKQNLKGSNGYQQSDRSKKYTFDERNSQNYGKKLNVANAVIYKDDENFTESGSDSDSDEFELEELETPIWSDKSLTSINTSFYKPCEITENRSAADIDAFRLKMHIKSNENMPKPIFKFDELGGLPDTIIAEIESQFSANCMPVQAQGLPMALSGTNMIVVSQLGSGKTLSMVLSAIVHVLNQTPTNLVDGPIAVILAPTAEMAEQIQLLANQLCSETNIKTALLCSDSKQCNSHKFTEVIDLLVATPDSLYEILRTKSLALWRCSYFTLYEADKMTDLCLDEEISQIASQIRPDCQKVIWSTLWNSEVKLLTTELIDDYTRLDVGSSAAVKVNLSQNIQQIVKVSENEKKENVLNEIIDLIESQADDRRKTLIFTETQDKADKIADILKKRGIKGQSFHNRKSTRQCDAILTEFNNDEFQFLILTDVAAKNVNFCRISNVINFDMPISILDYVNRLNRTGRANDVVGTAYSIFTEEDVYLVDDLIAILRQSTQTIDPALFILRAANADSDDEISFAVPKGKSYQKYTIDRTKK